MFKGYSAVEVFPGYPEVNGTLRSKDWFTPLRDKSGASKLVQGCVDRLRRGCH